MRYKLLILEVDDVVARRHSELPCLYVGIQKAQISAMESYDLPDWVRNASPVEREDLTPSTRFSMKTNAQERKARLIGSLGAKGYTINQCTVVYSLYVIELQPVPAKDGEARAVYVGETAKTPKDRYEEHMRGGIRSSRHVAKRGKCLCPDLAPRQKYYSREASKAAEKRLAERLEAKGFAVYGGH
jgi:hypothetical protein